ncbi:RmlD_sub_bind domain-containing protein [Haematococcus lacustris]|uniref:RmlD_sub_bind domain-containing protein n=1 Tax=Haematococcus lacustris TaxID=44745 RepID=A0A699Y9Z6_HAELA|nr:RmlD_sub_bind domain-containing protein [Haematococcus lacustris]
MARLDYPYATTLSTQAAHHYNMVVAKRAVYDGSRPHWKETDPCRPVNAYGRSKLEAEQLIQAAEPGPWVLGLAASYSPGSKPLLSVAGSTADWAPWGLLNRSPCPPIAKVPRGGLVTQGCHMRPCTSALYHLYWVAT